MKRHLLIVLILFASLMHTISYASDDSNSGEKAFIFPEADTLVTPTISAPELVVATGISVVISA